MSAHATLEDAIEYGRKTIPGPCVIWEVPNGTGRLFSPLADKPELDVRAWRSGWARVRRFDAASAANSAAYR